MLAKCPRCMVERPIGVTRVEQNGAPVHFCESCNFVLDASDLMFLSRKPSSTVKQKKRLTTDEAKMKFRQEVSRLLGVADWPVYSKEEEEQARHDTPHSRFGWPGDER